MYRRIAISVFSPFALAAFFFMLPHSRVYSTKAVQSNKTIRKAPMRRSPVVIIHLKVGSEDVIYDRPFIAPDDWLKNLSFDLKNISGEAKHGVNKNVTFVRFGLRIFDGQNLVANYPISCGTNNLLPNVQPTVLLKPGDTTHIEFTEARYNHLQAFLGKLAIRSQVNTIMIAVDTVVYEDGTTFFQGQDSQASKSSSKSDAKNAFITLPKVGTRFLSGEAYSYKNSFNYKNIETRKPPLLSPKARTFNCYYTTGQTVSFCDVEPFTLESCYYMRNNYTAAFDGAFDVTFGSPEMCATDFFDPENTGCRIVYNDFIIGVCDECFPEECDFPNYYWCDSICDCIPAFEYCY